MAAARGAALGKRQPLKRYVTIKLHVLLRIGQLVKASADPLDLPFSVKLREQVLHVGIFAPDSLGYFLDVHWSAGPRQHRDDLPAFWRCWCLRLGAKYFPSALFVLLDGDVELFE